MKMNIKSRLRNKTFIITFFTAFLAFSYQVASMLGVCMPISQDQSTQVIMLIINMLMALGILIDPTTKGIGDSDK